VRLVVATTASALGLAIIATGALAATGDLTQKVDPNGCIADSADSAVTGCDNNGKALYAAQSVTISPDGTSAYVPTSGSDAVAVFNRELTPVPPAELSLTLKLSKQLSGSKLKATVGCDLDCTTTLAGTVRIKIKGRAVAAARQINSKSLDLIANESAIVKLKLKPRARKAMKRALRRGHKVKAAVRTRAKDAAGSVEKMKVGVRLR